MANRAFWIARAGSGYSGPARGAALLADRWIKVPPATPGLAQFAAWTNPTTVGRCIVASHLGTVTTAGTTIYEGRPVVVLRDHGNVPGSAPGELYVTTTGRVLPVREMQTAPSQPGGVPERACGETSAPMRTTATGDLTFSRYNQPVAITAPANAISISGLQSPQA